MPFSISLALSFSERRAAFFPAFDACSFILWPLRDLVFIYGKINTCLLLRDELCALNDNFEPEYRVIPLILDESEDVLNIKLETERQLVMPRSFSCATPDHVHCVSNLVLQGSSYIEFVFSSG